jgi:hypothetical protein
MNNRLTVASLSSVVVLSMSGCSLWSPFGSSDALPPPVVSKQPRLLQVPDDLRLQKPAAAAAPPMAVAQAPAVAPPVVPASASAAQAVVPVAVAPAEPQKMMFAPYLPSSSESLPPKEWEIDPSHDFPWIAGARPTRVNEETIMGTGSRMFGRLFANVEFGTGAIAPPTQPKPEVVAAAAQQHKSGSLLSRWFKSQPKEVNPLVVPVNTNPSSLHAAGIRCEGVTCLDVARNMLLQDAERKGWKAILNRRVSLHQSFQFRRDDRIVSIEITPDGGGKLKLEYAITPNQTANVQATQNPLLPASGFAGPKPLSIGLKGAESKVSAILTRDWTIGVTDTTLKALLTRWSERARWTLVWESDLDLPLSSSSGTINADFPSALKIAMDTLVIESDRLIVDILESDKVIRVKRRY